MAAALGKLLRSGLVASTQLSRPVPRFAVSSLLPARLLSTRANAKNEEWREEGAAKAPKGAKAAPAIVAEDFEADEGEFDVGPVSVQRRVLRLKEVQDEYDTINRTYQKELALLQAKFYEQYQPLFDKRKEVLTGAVKVDSFGLTDDGEADEGIPEFWLTAFANHDKVGMYITERDAEVLRHLVDVRAKVLTGEERGFELTFEFRENEFLADKTLTKTYLLEPEDDVIPKEFIGCKINWKEESLNPTVEQKKRRVKGKSAAKGKPAFVTELTPCESFFNIFDPPKIPATPEELEDEELEALQSELSADFDIGFSIKDQIIPRAVEWFTGELAEPYDEDEFEEGEDFEGYGDEEFDDAPQPKSRRG